MLDLGESIASRHFPTHNKKNDAEEPHYDGERVHLIPEAGRALRVFTETGLIGASTDYEVGGRQLPVVVADACMAWFQATNVGTAAYPSLTIGSADLMFAHGSQSEVPPPAQPASHRPGPLTVRLPANVCGQNTGDPWRPCRPPPPIRGRPPRSVRRSRRPGPSWSS